MKKYLLVTAVPSADETFAGALGITKDREDRINELLDQSHEETNTYPDALALLSAKLKTANELAYASFHLGAFAESKRWKQELVEKLLS